MNEFDNWLKEEVDKEKTEECMKRDGECYNCSFKEDCEYESLLNELDNF